MTSPALPEIADDAVAVWLMRARDELAPGAHPGHAPVDVDQDTLAAWRTIDSLLHEYRSSVRTDTPPWPTGDRAHALIASEHVEFRAVGDYSGTLRDLRPRDEHVHAQMDAVSMTLADSTWIERRVVAVGPWTPCSAPQPMERRG
jgi:hypothetical protein